MPGTTLRTLKEKEKRKEQKKERAMHLASAVLSFSTCHTRICVAGQVDPVFRVLALPDKRDTSQFTRQEERRDRILEQTSTAVTDKVTEPKDSSLSRRGFKTRDHRRKS